MHSLRCVVAVSPGGRRCRHHSSEIRVCYRSIFHRKLFGIASSLCTRPTDGVLLHRMGLASTNRRYLKLKIVFMSSRSLTGLARCGLLTGMACALFSHPSYHPSVANRAGAVFLWLRGKESDNTEKRIKGEKIDFSSWELKVDSPGYYHLYFSNCLGVYTSLKVTRRLYGCHNSGRLRCSLAPV